MKILYLCCTHGLPLVEKLVEIVREAEPSASFACETVKESGDLSGVEVPPGTALILFAACNPVPRPPELPEDYLGCVTTLYGVAHVAYVIGNSDSQFAEKAWGGEIRRGIEYAKNLLPMALAAP